MDLEQILLLCGGLILLTAGAEFLVRGASRLAAKVGVSPLVIGLTVVAYGTSTPELVVSVQAALAGQADISVANVVGSNIFNVLFILGTCAVISPLIVSQQLVRIDVPIMIGASLLLLVLSFDGKLDRFDAAILFGGVVAYTIFAIRASRAETTAVKEEYAREYGQNKLASNNLGQLLLQIVYIAAGLGLLILGSTWLIESSIALAQALGVSELVIGLTIVAAGTSLPEVATSIVATIRGERDIAIGNVVGSNIYNILAILGIASFIPAAGLNVAPAMVTFDIPVMIAVALACAPIFFTGHLIARWEGALFLLYYGAYTAYLILNAQAHDRLPAFSAVMLEFVLPLTMITLAIVYVRQAAKPDRQAALNKP